MSKLLFALAICCTLLALASRQLHHSARFSFLLGAAIISAILGLISLRRHPVTHFLHEMRRLAD
jgi:hypothetical protein